MDDMQMIDLSEQKENIKKDKFMSGIIISLIILVILFLIIYFFGYEIFKQFIKV